MRQKTIAILALLAIMLGAVPAMTGALLAMPASCACCQSGFCPMMRHAARSHRGPLCASHPLSQAAPCNMNCCQPQSMHALSGTPFTLAAPGGICAPALFAFDFSPRLNSLPSAAREITPPPPKYLLA